MKWKGRSINGLERSMFTAFHTFTYSAFLYLKLNNQITHYRISKNKWRVQMQKPLNAIWNFLLKLPFLSSLYI